MDKLISAEKLYNKITEFEELARNRVLDTPTTSHAYPRYVAQLNERTALKHMIMDEPAAFDKEKVIDKLVELRQKEYNDNEKEEDLTDGEEIYDAGRSQGRFEAYHKTIEIIEKGGIE